jgi:carboxypeptidase C (cathepsin A)
MWKPDRLYYRAMLKNILKLVRTCGASVIAGCACAVLSMPAHASPASGYWWNPAEGGNGFVIEVEGSAMFFAGFLYDTSGRATWVASTGPLTSATQYSGALYAYSGGQTLTGAYTTASQSPSLGNVTVNFSSDTQASLSWPGGTLPIQRYDFGPGGSGATQPAGTPQAGYWWNPAEGGRGFTIEVQGGTMYLAGYMYDASGNPLWYLANGTMTSSSLFLGQWTQYANGLTLSGNYQAPILVNANVGAVTLQFSDPANGTLTLPNGRQIPLTRYNFGFTDPVAYSTSASASLQQAAELTAVTHHKITVGGTVLNYTATAGHMNALALSGAAPEASFFYVAYTLDNQNPATRPVTFFYNGGPGSSTVWLHLGSFGPRRLVTGDPATTEPVPFPLVDNAESLLDTSDLVFVDAVGTGLSEAISPYNNQSFWGVDADAAVFRDFIMRYLTVNGRNASPKFLFGESYGTPRSAVLSNLLESAGVELNGVVLQSSILNYNSNCGVLFPSSVSCEGYLPSYGAVGAWYQLDNPNPASLPTYEATLRTFASAQYGPAVSSFLANGTQPSNALLTQLANYTGMRASQWQQVFNMDPGYYQYDLIPGVLIGGYDARVNAPMGSFLASEGDPSSTYLTASFTTQITTYLSSELKYSSSTGYVLESNAINSWDFSHDGQQLPDTIPDLAAAFAQNPALQVLSVNGYHDIVTPFFQTQLDLTRLGTGVNVQTRFYTGGHMTYLDDGSRPLEKADLVQFYQAAGAP